MTVDSKLLFFKPNDSPDWYNVDSTAELTIYHGKSPRRNEYLYYDEKHRAALFAQYSY